MQRNVPTVHQNSSFHEAFQLMNGCECPGLGVVDSRGRLVGLITPEAIGEMIMVRSALPDSNLPSWRRGMAATSAFR
jgi:predicted transcriptional regulator